MFFHALQSLKYKWYQSFQTWRCWPLMSTPSWECVPELPSWPAFFAWCYISTREAGCLTTFRQATTQMPVSPPQCSSPAKQVKSSQVLEPQPLVASYSSFIFLMFTFYSLFSLYFISTLYSCTPSDDLNFVPY